MTKMKDGWHTVKGYEVYVEDGKILRGVKNDTNGSRVPAYPYKWESTNNAWCKGTPTVSAFRGKSWELK